MDNKIVKHIESLAVIDLVEDSAVKNQFIEKFNDIHRSDLGEIGKTFCEKEQFNFNKLLQENADLQQCTKLSLYGAWLDVAVNGLSLDNTSKPLCYLMSRFAKAKNEKGEDIWEKRAYIKLSPSGEIFVRKMVGQIKEADDPQIVWEGDTIKVGLNDKGKHIVKEHDRLIPRKKDAKIIGGYIRIERFDGSYECSWMDIADVERLKAYSNKQNKGTATDDKSNTLYKSYHGQIDPGFFEAKITRHAFDSYQKFRVGTQTELPGFEESKILEEKQKENPNNFQDAEDITNKNNFDTTPPQQPEKTVTFEEDYNNF